MYQEYAMTAAIVTSSPRMSPTVGERFLKDNAIFREYNAALAVANRIWRIGVAYSSVRVIKTENRVPLGLFGCLLREMVVSSFPSPVMGQEGCDGYVLGPWFRQLA